MGRSEIRPSGVERQSCNDQPPTGSKPLRSNLLSDTRCRGSPQAPLFPPAPRPSRAPSCILRTASSSSTYPQSGSFTSFFVLSFLLIFFSALIFLFFIPSTFWKRGTAGLGFDVRTRNGRDQLQCLIVFYDHQVPQTLKVPEHYSSRHDLVLVFH